MVENQIRSSIWYEYTVPGISDDIIILVLVYNYEVWTSEKILPALADRPCDSPTHSCLCWASQPCWTRNWLRRRRHCSAVRFDPSRHRRPHWRQPRLHSGDSGDQRQRLARCPVSLQREWATAEAKRMIRRIRRSAEIPYTTITLRLSRWTLIHHC